MRLSQLLRKFAGKENLPKGDHSDGGLPLNIEDWPEDWRNRLREKAAMIEMSQGTTQQEAERLADIEIRSLRQIEKAQQEGPKN